jgi:hypothetical protein
VKYQEFSAQSNATLKTQINLNSMKLFKTLALIALASCCAATLNAQTKVYITGSTAYRSAVHTAILHIYDTTPTPVSFGYTGTSFGGASQAIFEGTIGGVSTNIYTSWSGSEAGIQTVADPNPATTVNFLPDSTTVSPSPGSGSAPTGTDPHKPLVAMSDTFQSTSQFNSTFNGVTYNALLEADGTSSGHGSPVGVVAFKWCASAGASFANITSQLCRSLYNAGKLPLALFTGSSADETSVVIALGRNPDSGTRLTAFAESGIGALSGVKQFEPLDSAAAQVTSPSSTITKFVNWPAETINGVPVSTFNSGYSSGGNLSKAMRAVTSDPVTIQIGAGTKSYAASIVTRVGYLGTSDADPNLLSGSGPALGTELSYNGVSLGNVNGDYNTVTALTEGKYTFWGFEHLLYNSGIDTTVKGVADKLATQLHDTDAVVKLSSMKVTRATDGANVTANYATP